MRSLIVALDLPSASKALALVDELGEPATYFKVGAQLFTGAGPQLIAELKDREKQVFLDLKYHDIPNTVARAVEAAAALDVDMVTLHASGGSAMLAAARDAVGDDGPALIGVTLLTSFTAADVEEVWDKELRSIRDEVVRLSGLAASAGLDGVVASALEAEGLKRKHGPSFLVVTPGIRPQGEIASDQVRTATPAEAARAGADYIVVGRPVYEAPDPAEAFQQLLAEVGLGDEVETAP
jgi:orotidine-5'-phosphate decarboxylase